MENVVSFKQQVLKKDLEAFSKALFEANMKLQIENQGLLEKIAHLEELLMNSDIPTIGSGLNMHDNITASLSQETKQQFRGLIPLDDYDRE